MSEVRSLIKVRNLDLEYDEYRVLQDVGFDLEKGKCLVVMGGSGCGKSTLLKSMIGLLRPTNGRIEVDGISLWDANYGDRKKILRKFGVLFQGGALWSSMSILENVSLPLKLHSGLSEADSEKIGRYKLNLVGLAGFENFFPAELSGGMRKRAGLALSLIHI